MPNTPNYALPYPASTNVPDVPTDMAALANRIEVAIAPGTATGQIPVWNNSSKVWGPSAPGAATNPPLVTTLPGSPADGDEVYYLADASLGIVWHLRYRAASASAYKWEFVGGPGMEAEVATQQTCALSAPLIDLATVGPQLTLPRPGVYALEWGWAMGGVTAATTQAMCTIVDVTGSPVSWGWNGLARGEVNAPFASYASSQTGGVAAAGTILRLRYASNAAACDFANRWIRARPVRVS